MRKRLSIIIPAKNEENSILLTLQSLKNSVRIPHEIIIINDRSSDNTESIVKKYIGRNKNVSLIKTTPNKGGFSNAIKKGIWKSSADIVVVVMADLCDDPKTINKMYEKIAEGWDIVCGSRYMQHGKKIGGPKIQNFFSALVCKSLHYILRMPTEDASNAFKMYRKNVFKTLEYKSNSGVESSLDLILRAHFQGFKIIDIPTTWQGRTAGESKFKLIERSPRYAKIYLWALKQTLIELFS